MIGNGVRRPKNPSIDTTDSTESRFSLESQKSRNGPPPGTYLFQIPKDAVYRVPPPENAHRYQNLTRDKSNRSTCRRCFCFSFAFLLLLLLIGALLVGLLHLIYRPEKPDFAVSEVSFAGFNLTSSSPISPVIIAKVRFRNRNSKLALIYEKGIVASIFYDGVKFGDGEFTEFKQSARNVTVKTTELKGSSIQLTSSSKKDLTELQNKGKIPFDLMIEVPVKFKVCVVTMSTITIDVDCKVTVDKLTESANVLTENCGTGLTLV